MFKVQNEKKIYRLLNLNISAEELSIYKLKDQKNTIHLNVAFEERKHTFIVIFFYTVVSIIYLVFSPWVFKCYCVHCIL